MEDLACNEVWNSLFKFLKSGTDLLLNLNSKTSLEDQIRENPSFILLNYLTSGRGDSQMEINPGKFHYLGKEVFQNKVENPHSYFFLSSCEPEKAKKQIYVRR